MNSNEATVHVHDVENQQEETINNTVHHKNRSRVAADEKGDTINDTENQSAASTISASDTHVSPKKFVDASQDPLHTEDFNII